jgi:hypothetical protein
MFEDGIVVTEATVDLAGLTVTVDAELVITVTLVTIIV